MKQIIVLFSLVLYLLSTVAIPQQQSASSIQFPPIQPSSTIPRKGKDTGVLQSKCKLDAWHVVLQSCFETCMIVHLSADPVATPMEERVSPQPASSPGSPTVDTLSKPLQCFCCQVSEALFT